MRSFALFFSALALISVAACGSSTEGSGGAGATATTTTTATSTGTSTSSTTTGSAGGSTTTTATGGSGGGTTTTTTSSSSSTTTTGTGGSVPIQACSEIGAEDCFSNLDCMTADRCENKGTMDLPTPCCVPGARGTGKSGEACTVDNDCETSLCVETSSGYKCSGECTMSADCPPELPVCTKVPAILGKGAFCFPS